MDNSLFIKNDKFDYNTPEFKSNFTKYVEIDVSQKENIDTFLSQFVQQHLSNHFCNIFIPISFGEILSDFLGLRLALHIRTSKHECQNSNIFIYSSGTVDEIQKYSELYKILFTKGIELIPLDKFSILKNINRPVILKNDEERILELKKINLSVPKSFYDSHSIANIWGATQLMNTMGLTPENVPSLDFEKLNHIYFKWLSSINKTDKLRNKKIKAIEKESTKKLQGLSHVSLDEEALSVLNKNLGL